MLEGLIRMFPHSIKERYNAWRKCAICVQKLEIERGYKVVSYAFFVDAGMIHGIPGYGI